ncbi:helix-turn-helix transcriptional regulator [Streptomyces sp. AM 2-1-1]|uniref:helix-turn-helix domain-containing protein n=1 Tax=Streptomyces sp. AM 2-1-1 TaxID=3028709 RepID=UPI0023B995F0|nr:helix-turn-helix transcriptional regulator [Streptomyces sp. AM 2-1-1]WEH40282.1 helix-turn-helix transcriptional regulator [Streptomyces sp. AM 2-1-1]
MDWTALGQALRAARESAGLRQVDVAKRLDVGESTVQSIERGQQFNKPTRTIRAYAAELGWSSGAVERVLAGGEPIVEEAVHRPDLTPFEPTAALSDSGLPLRIVADLTDSGPLLDTVVISLPGGGQAVVVVKGKAGGSPQEIQEALEAWRRTQTHLVERFVGEARPAESEAEAEREIRS